MLRRFTKRRRLVALSVVALVGGTGAAFASFTTTGSGSGTATVGSSSPITLSSDPVSGLFPGGGAVTVTVHVANPGGGDEYVGTITGTVEDNGGCLGSWFTVSPITYNTDVAAGSPGPDATTGVTLTNTGGDQNACQGADMTIDWSSS